MSKLQGLSVKLPLAYSTQDGHTGSTKVYKKLFNKNLKNLVLTAPGRKGHSPTLVLC